MGNLHKQALLKELQQFSNKNFIAMVLAQCHHESGGFLHIQESFAYRPETLLKVFPKRFKDIIDTKESVVKGKEYIADRLYLNRMGNTSTGDGYKYSGKGILQLTGKNNYKEFSELLGIDFVNNPELVLVPENSAKIAVKFFTKNKELMEYSEEGNVKECTRIINGGYNGLEARSKLFSEYVKH